MTHVRETVECGQMAVEMAVALPIILIVMAIAIDCAAFIGECARFDQLAPQATLALASSPAREQQEGQMRVAAVQEELAGKFSEHGGDVSVKAEGGDGLVTRTCVYVFTLRMAPWPLSASGAPKMLAHTYRFAFNPYTPGEL